MNASRHRPAPASPAGLTAAFLLLKDSKSSFAIENENPPHDRIQRWGRAIGEAGRRPIDLDELFSLIERVRSAGALVGKASASKTDA